MFVFEIVSDGNYEHQLLAQKNCFFFFLQILILRATTVSRRELLKLLQTEEFYALRKQVMVVMWNVEIIAGFTSKDSLVIGSLRFMLGSVLLSSLMSPRRKSGSNARF